MMGVTLCRKPSQDSTTITQLFSLRLLIYLSSILLIFLLLGIPSQVHAAGIPQKQTLSRRILADGPIDWLALTPDGKYAVYYTNDFTSSNPTQGISRVSLGEREARQQLNGAVSVLSVPQLTPDGKVVVFLGNEEGLGNALYAAPVDTGTPVRLAEPDQNFNIISGLQIGADSKHVLFVDYAVDEDGASGPVLFRADIQAQSTLALTQPTEPVGVWKLSPDGKQVVYISPAGLHTMPITGGTPTLLYPTDNQARWIFDFLISPDSSHVVYAVDETVFGLLEVYSVPIVGGEPVRLSYPHALGGSDGFSYDGLMAITPDSDTVLFAAQRTLANPAQLYAVPIQGGEPIALGPLLPRERIQAWTQQTQSSNGDSRIAYATHNVDTNQINLYQANVHNGESTQINLTADEVVIPVSGGYVVYLSPDGQYVIFQEEHDSPSGRRRIYSASLRDKSAIMLGESAEMYDARFSTDSRHFYFLSPSFNGLQELCRVVVTGGALQCVTLDLGQITGYLIAPDGNMVFSDYARLYVTVTMPHTMYLPKTQRDLSVKSAKDVVNVLQDLGGFDVFVRMLLASGLSEPLRGFGPYTIFAPTDEAFAALPAGAVDELLNDPTGQLIQILLYQIVRGSIPTEAIYAGLQVQSQQGKFLQFEYDGERIKVNGANLVQADIQAPNGIIHGIDAVLLPPPGSTVVSQ